MANPRIEAIGEAFAGVAAVVVYIGITLLSAMVPFVLWDGIKWLWRSIFG